MSDKIIFRQNHNTKLNNKCSFSAIISVYAFILITFITILPTNGQATSAN